MHEDALFAVSVEFDDEDDGRKYRGRKHYLTLAASFEAAADKVRQKLPSLALVNPAVRGVDVMQDYIA